ncbi:type I DNA topoisomerase [Patescibacteria group bacterium]|nr:type I DNA topoisomerase [Patescibacteria group bacterium]
MKLVIVESPTKAKTITRFLGKGYKVMASYGHLRDLPKTKLGVDTENDFEPTYAVSPKNRAKVKELNAAAKKADSILFATDEDREGEAISWHLVQLLDQKPGKIQRIVFHEITKEAIERALEDPRELDMHMVDAQQARRILDRLVGYKLSPFLWHQIRRGLSAGRVQSVALRMIVEREREIKAFNPEEYWTIEGMFKPEKTENTFDAKLHELDGKTLDKMAIKTKKEADEILDSIKDKPFTITRVEGKEKKSSPPAPFITSSLQQEANGRLGFSAKQTMTIAQKLYEGMKIGDNESTGLITYMRTDYVNLAEKFIKDASVFLKDELGAEYILDKPRTYKTKSKTAQEAHEAIRPTDPSRTPDSLEAYLDPGQLKLYRLIWQRALATQMPDAKLLGTSVDLTSGTAVFRATGQRVVFDGYLKIYPDQDKDKLLPELVEGRPVEAVSIDGKQHFTEPPARYSDASLVKALEKFEIGRPSTYAPTISTIIDRGYVEREENKRLVPTDIAYEVNDLLVEHFPDIVDLKFTARMEDTLDDIASGKAEWRPVLKEFYEPFEKNLMLKEKELEKEAAKEAEGVVCPECSGAMVLKHGRYGKFFACTKYPECKGTKPLPGEKPKAKPEPTDEKCEKCNSMMVKKIGRFGPFLSCSAYPECKTIKKIDVFVKDSQGKQIACPKCEKGQIVERKSKKGKVFFSCNRYPECDQAFWDRPTGEPCPECNYPTLTRKGKNLVCPSEECKFKQEAPQEE